MTREEQNIFLSAEHAEAMRYMDNAKETLKKARRDGTRYTDQKYVQTACGTAYLGVLIAVDAWFKLKGISEFSRKRQRKSIAYYMDALATIDKKAQANLREVYDILHVYGYYDGTLSVKVIEGGFELAYIIIDKIKPERFVDVPETRGGKVKRAWNQMMVALSVMFMGRR